MPAKPFSSKGSPLAPYHLRDDFGDGGPFDDRNGSETGIHFDGQRSSVASTLLAGRNRPRWRVYDSGPGIENGGLEHAYRSGSGGVVTGCKQTIGEWEIRLQFPTRETDPSPDTVDATLVGAHPGYECPRWGLTIRSDRSVRLYKASDAARDGVADGETVEMVSGTIPRADQQHTVSARRDPDNSWHLSINGISQGTARDAFLPPTGVFALRFDEGSDAGSEVHIDHVEVR